MPSALMQTLWLALPPVSSSLWLTSTLTTVLSKSSSTPAVGTSVPSPPISTSLASYWRTFAALQGILASSFLRGSGGGGGGSTCNHIIWEVIHWSSEKAPQAVADSDVWVCGRRFLLVRPRFNSHPTLYVWGQWSPRGRNKPWSHWSNKPLMKVLFINRSALSFSGITGTQSGAKRHQRETDFCSNASLKRISATYRLKKKMSLKR